MLVNVNYQNVTGSVNLSGSNTVNVATTGSAGLEVGNAPYAPLWVTITSSLPVTFAGLPQLQISNFPAVQAVSGTVGVNNFPLTQNVSGTVGAVIQNWPAIHGVSGTVSVNNFPAGQLVSGTVRTWDGGTQAVSGTVNVTVSGSTGLMIAAPITAPAWITGSVALNPTPTINAATSTTGTLGLAVGNAPYNPLWVTSTGSWAIQGTTTTGSALPAGNPPVVQGGVFLSSSWAPTGSLINWLGSAIPSGTYTPIVTSIQTDVSGAVIVIPRGESHNASRAMHVDRYGYVVPGYQTLQFTDIIEGSTINTQIWSGSVNLFTQAQSLGVITLNNGVTKASGSYSILVSNKQFPLYHNDVTLACSFYAAVGITAITMGELGFGSPFSTVVPMNDGAFFRFVASAGGAGADVYGVTAYNGVENVAGPLGTISTVNNTYYQFSIAVQENGVRFSIESVLTGVPVIEAFMMVPNTTPSVSSKSHVPVCARVFTLGAALFAPQLKVAACNVWQRDINTSKPWADQQAMVGRSAGIDPVLYGQTSTLSASAAPPTNTPLSQSCIAPTLGGEFVLNGTATSENFLGVFGYLVPSPYSFYITDIMFPPPVVSTALGATVMIQEWALMVTNNPASNNPFTARGVRYPLGMYSAAASAVAGTVFNGQALNPKFRTPIPVNPGQYVMVMVKVISGAASGVYRGVIFINGYFE